MRVFSAYGEGLRKQLFWDIYQKSKQGDNVELFGTGEETRDFIYIKDILLAIDCILSASPFDADIVNVASGVSFSIRDAATLFLETMEIKKDIRFTNIIKQGDPIGWKADISKLRAYGFIPSFDLKDGFLGYKQWIIQN